MTVNETLKAIEVMKAFTEGKEIQVRQREGSNTWNRVRSESGCTPEWNWSGFEYRAIRSS